MKTSHPSNIQMTQLERQISIQDQQNQSNEIRWKDLDGFGRVKRVLLLTGKFLALLALLYTFVCSLDIMSSAFRLVGGRITGKAFSEGAVLANPIAGLMLGLLATVIVQSSSTSTSIVVSMVSSSILPVRQAIPIIMGANIGTSVTNTIVALTQSTRRDEFRRAFAGATVHDMFNWATVIILLPLEVVSGVLFHLTEAITNTISLDRKSSSNPQFLNVLTKPLTHRIIQLDEKVIQEIAMGSNQTDGSILKRFCSVKNVTYENLTTALVPDRRCNSMFSHVSWPDWAVGLLLLIISLIALCACLIFLVKLLQSMLKGTLSQIIFKTVNANFPGIFHHLTPYLAIAVGCIFTILVQSSSIFTSTLTPLVGMGIITIERVYPFTLGSNIGTTITGIMAALTATTPIELRHSLQIALCHTFFNIFGIIIWFPIPFMRNVPIRLAKKLGEVTANYRWFAIVYIVGAFFVIPLVIFSISLAGWRVFLGIFVPIVALILFAVTVHILQRYHPKVLPEKLQDWSWLPRPLHSLSWYDEHFFQKHKKLLCCRSTKSKNENSNSNRQLDTNSGQTNLSFIIENQSVDRMSATSTRF